MDSQQSMFVVLGAFYLFESLLWLPKDSLALVAGVTGRFRLIRPESLLKNEHGAAVWKALLPPGRSTFLTTAMPVAVSPEGVAKTDSGDEALTWEDIETLSPKGRWIRINGRKWWKTPSYHNSVQLAGRLNAIRKAPSTDREKAIGNWMTERFRSKDAASALDDIRKPLRTLRVLANILFVCLFVALLPLSFVYSYQNLWGWIFGGMLLQTIPIAVLFRRLHARLYPEADDERFTAWLTMALFAPAAIRAHDLVTLPLLYRFHPMVAAAAVMKESDARQYAGKQLRALHFRSGGDRIETEESLSQRILSWQRARTLARVEKFCESSGWKVENLLRAPERTDPEAKSYCPRCFAEFILEDGVCSDCGGVSLRRFEET